MDLIAFGNGTAEREVWGKLVADAERPRGVEDLVALISSATASGALIFTLVLYAHYFHLHTYTNHIFVIISLGSAFLFANSIFWNIFVFPDDAARYSTAHCRWAGFANEVVTVCMLWGVVASWLGLAAHLHRWRRLIIFRVRGVVFTGLIALLAGVVAASIAVGVDGVGQYKQAWCRGANAWYVAIFHLLPTALSVVPMLMVVIPPLRSERVNADQKRLVLRRAIGHAVWVAVIAYSSLGTLYESSHFGKIEQAALGPLSGVVLAFSFLISERMLTFRALGLPPGADPPSGFTNAMHYIPDKLSYDDTTSLLRDTTLHHNIVKA